MRNTKGNQYWPPYATVSSVSKALMDLGKQYAEYESWLSTETHNFRLFRSNEAPRTSVVYKFRLIRTNRQNSCGAF